MSTIYNYQSALDDFDKARRRAAIQQLFSRFTGEDTELLSFDDVRQQLRATTTVDRGLQDIPLDKIVGSVGRYKDFTRDFLPKANIDRARWAQVKKAVEDLKGLPPIETYKLGDVYFVIDGNHRVSIARRVGAPTISGYVKEVTSRVSVTPDDDPIDIILKARYVRFLEKTNLDKLRPDVDLLMSFAGQYRLILEHIDVHHYYMGLEQSREITYEEAVTSWYDNVYLPVVALVRKQGVLRYFPNRTEADMYVLLAEHRVELQEMLGWDVSTETAVTEFSKKPRSPLQAIANAGGKLIEAVVPDELEGGPPAGQWRLDRVNKRPSGTLFDDLLVSVTGHEDDWGAIDVAIGIALRGGSRLFGLHVLKKPIENGASPKSKQKIAKSITKIQTEFERRCQEAGVDFQFAVEDGPTAPRIVDRSVYVDGVILPLYNPPGKTWKERSVSQLQTIIRQCPRPILTIPNGTKSKMRHALLAYGGHPSMAQEALYVAAYSAARYHVKLTVLSVGDAIQTNKLLAQARAYLQQVGAEADFVASNGEVEKSILETAVSVGADHLIVGSFSYGSLRSLMLGSTVNRLLLQDYRNPILICR